MVLWNTKKNSDIFHDYFSFTLKDFTAPQTVYTIKTDENVVLNGTFNNIDLDNYFSLTQFKNQPIIFKNASFGLYYVFQ